MVASSKSKKKSKAAQQQQQQQGGEEATYSSRPPSGQDKELRTPFRIAAHVGSKAARGVNRTVDSSHKAASLVSHAISNNTLVKGLSDSLTSAQETAERVVSPHLEPLQPYFNRIRPYIPPAMLVGLLLCLPPVIFLLSLAAFITSPIWIVALVIASPIWIPMAIFTGAATFLGLVIGAIRVLSTSQAQRVLAPVWTSVSSTSLGQAIFFSSRKL